MITIVVALLTLAGCASTASTAAPTGTAAEPAAVTAQQVVTALAQHVPSTKPSVVYDALTDPNHLLGRPGGYTSKATFIDTRIPERQTAGSTEGAVERGGSVEVFTDGQAAQKRKDAIQALASGLPMAVEYDYLAGPVLLRVSRILTPAHAVEYQTALGQLG